MYGFLGPNGAGKTTTVRMLVTLLRPTGGHARVAGYDVASQPSQVRRRIGVALQEAALDPLMTGSELIELQATLHGIAPRSVRARGADLIERVGLSAAAGRRVGTYSGGMRRRLDLAMALIHEPDVLFLDEPTTGLDPTSRLTLWAEVRRLRDEGTTVFLTTQYLEEADQLADRIGIIADGRIVAEGTPASLKAEVGHPHLDLVLADGSDLHAAREVVARFGERRPSTADCHLSIALRRGAPDITPILRALDDAGFEVAELELKRPTLDDVFLDKTGEHLEGADVPEAEPAAA
ncbi:MAG: type transport system ATP-binding protein [bacterium]